MISTNQFKNGNHIEVEGTVFKIIEFQHVKPGKGGAFVRTKLRRASDGAVIDRTFRAGEKFRPVRTEARKMQFLYADGTDAHFMDEESYDQIALPETGRRRGAEVDQAQRERRPALHRRRPRRTSSCRRRSSSRSRTRSRASAATPPPAAATSPPRWRPARRSTCRCSSTSGTGSRSTPARAPTCPAREVARRSDQRRAAVFALYQHDLTGRPLDDVFERDAASFTRALAHATADNAEDLDPRIERHATGWSLDRIAPLERAIMRTALLEMLHPDLVEGDRPIPPEGAIDEAVETAKAFCGADAPGFVNGCWPRRCESARPSAALGAEPERPVGLAREAAASAFCGFVNPAPPALVWRRLSSTIPAPRRRRSASSTSRPYSAPRPARPPGRRSRSRPRC